MAKDHSEHLYALIKSLSKSEKRYFKIKYKSDQGSDSKYLRLFDEIDKAQEFDEKELIQTNTWINPAADSKVRGPMDIQYVKHGGKNFLVLQEPALTEGPWKTEWP